MTHKSTAAARIGAAALALAAAGLAATATQAQTAPAQTSPGSAAADWRVVAPENLLVIDTSKGRILAELDPRVAPASVERIRTLTQAGFYDGLKFHRVISGFMAQTGDPLGTGAGNSDLPDVAAELQFRRGRAVDFATVPNAGPGVRGILGSVPIVTQPDAQMFVTADMKVTASGLFCPGVLGMARGAAVDSANSQFFFMMGVNTSLNGAYTPFGRVLQGQEVIEALKPGSPTQDGAVADPDVMTRVRIAASLPEAERPVARVMLPSAAAFFTRIAARQAARGTNFSICDVEIPVEITGGA